MEDLGPYLKAEREAQGLGLREAARRIGISHTRLTEIEKSRSYSTQDSTKPSRETLKKIAACYCLSEAVLLALAGYGGADLATLPADQSEVLALYDGLSPERKLLAIATLRAFATAPKLEEPEAAD